MQQQTLASLLDVYFKPERIPMITSAVTPGGRLPSNLPKTYTDVWKEKKEGIRLKQESEGHRWNANSDLKTITNLANELKRVPVAGVATSVNIRGRPPNDLPPQEGTANPTKVGGWRRTTQRVRIGGNKR